MAYSLRPARQDEARTVAEFYRLSSDGVADYIWTQLAEPGEDLLDVGERRYARTGTNFSFENCTFIESDGETAGMLVVFPMYVDPEYVQDDPVLAPYSELEEDQSLYICGLSVLEKFRRRGLGTVLLKETEAICRKKGLSRVSLAVFEDNKPAVRLYENAGYVTTKRVSVHPHPLIHYGGSALLMVKELDKPAK